MELKFIKNKRSQITIFVIIGLILIASIVLIFVLRNKSSINISGAENPNIYIQDCVSNALNDVETDILETNAYPNMTNNYILYRNEKVKYLCKASQFYAPCVNQEPMLVEYVRKQIQTKMDTKTKSCFNNLVYSLKRKGYEVKQSNLSFDIDFSSQAIIESINTNLIMKKNEETKTFQKFVVKLDSPIYALIDTARNIINYESTLCQFNSIGWMSQFRAIGIDRFMTSDQTKVYRVYDKETEKDFIFAIKTCVLPAGI
jgi:hypothetical protein